MLTLMTALILAPVADASSELASVTTEGRAVIGWAERLSGTMTRQEARSELTPAPTQAFITPITARTSRTGERLPIKGYAIGSIDPADFDLPIEVNPAVMHWIAYFTGPGVETIRVWNARKARVEPIISAKLSAAGLPQDLIYLAMIESGFVDTARSHAGATGPWQFMKPTAREAGLRVDSERDERRDLPLSTDAALGYLTTLYLMFDDWPLAMASYNGGQGRVMRAKKRSGGLGYFDLAGGGFLPKETANYVPKIMAAAIVSKNFAGFGIKHLPPEVPPDTTTVLVTATTDLSVLARLANTDVATIGRLNPALLRAYTPQGTTVLYIPTKGSSGFEKRFEKLSARERRVLREYRVVRGDTLGEIAQTNGLSISELKALNGLKSDTIQLGQVLLLDGSQKSVGRRPKHHKVRSGDTLSEIAEKYGCSERSLRKLNGLRGSVIQTGQRLKIPPSNG